MLVVNSNALFSVDLIIMFKSFCWFWCSKIYKVETDIKTLIKIHISMKLVNIFTFCSHLLKLLLTNFSNLKIDVYGFTFSFRITNTLKIEIYYTLKYVKYI